jgi:Tfp pilus assembly protein PilE
MRLRGLTIIETVFSVAILALLIVVVGDAVSHTLHAGSLHIGRASAIRSASTLETRLNEEARSSTSVFVPPTDVIGGDNSSTNAHEVDFFRKASDGSDAYVAYRFDRGSGTVTRYDYALVGNAPQPSHADLSAGGIASFYPQLVEVGTTGDVVGGRSVAPVSVYYGSSRNVGGNGVVLLDITTSAEGGAPAESTSIHLAAKSAPTDLAELVSGSPRPKGPVVVAFLIVPKLMKGPWHGGGGGDGDPNDIHNGAIPGTSVFIGGEGGPVNWFEVSQEEATLESGVYRYIDSDGNRIVLTVSCDGGHCPQFVPQPQQIPGGPKGVVIFRTAQ